MTITIDCTPDAVFDGRHTIGEVYYQRNLLLLALMRQRPDLSWFSQFRPDGTSYGTSFAAGMVLPSGDIAYELPGNLWDRAKATKARELDAAKNSINCSSITMAERLRNWIGFPENPLPKAPKKEKS